MGNISAATQANQRKCWVNNLSVQKVDAEAKESGPMNPGLPITDVRFIRYGSRKTMHILYNCT